MCCRRWTNVYLLEYLWLHTFKLAAYLRHDCPSNCGLGVISAFKGRCLESRPGLNSDENLNKRDGPKNDYEMTGHFKMILCPETMTPSMAVTTEEAVAFRRSLTETSRSRHHQFPCAQRRDGERKDKRVSRNQVGRGPRSVHRHHR